MNTVSESTLVYLAMAMATFQLSKKISKKNPIGRAAVSAMIASAAVNLYLNRRVNRTNRVNAEQYTPRFSLNARNRQRMFARPDQLSGIPFNATSMITKLPKELINDQCPICLSLLKDETCIKLPECTHMFHKQCIENYVNTPGVPRRCPLCRDASVFFGSRRQKHRHSKRMVFRKR